MRSAPAFALFATCSLIFSAPNAQAEAVPPARETPRLAPATAGGRAAPPEIAYEKFSLQNGLTVLLHRDPSLPLVAVNLWYHVGPRNEPPQRSGFAHLFEHLMFEGSRHVGRDADLLFESVGATNANGTTSYDRTNYFETVPSRELDLALWIESDRMGYLLDVLDQQRLDVQRDVVKNERRQSYENTPYGPSYLRLLDAIFPPGHPYNGAVIGSMADLSAATLGDVRSFFIDYYTPSNATLALSGDFELPAAKASIQKYFGSLPRRETKPTHDRPLPPVEGGRFVVHEPVELAEVTFGFRTPPAYGKDDPVIDVAMAVLAGGKATRLYRSLVVDKKLASDVSAAQESNQLAGIATVGATAASGKSVDELERALASELDKLARKGPLAAELQRAKRRILVATLQSLELLNGPGGETGRAGLLQRFNHYTGDPGYLPRWVEQIERVSVADVQRVLTQQLSPATRVVVVTLPEPANAEPAKSP